MSCPDLRMKRAARAGGSALALLLLLAGLMSLAPPAAASEASEAAVQPSGPGAALLERYTAEALSDAVLLRPIETGGLVRSIELTDDGEILLNGKEFDRDELEGFLGDDGRLVAELAEMEPDEIRASLGLEVEGERFGTDDEEDMVVEVPKHGRRIRVHAGGDDRVSVGTSIHLREGESARDLVCIGCSVDVEGAASGSAVAVGGSVRVTGSVGQDAVAVGGSVHVEDGAAVGGDAVAVGGAVHVAEGATTGGQRTSIGIGDAFLTGWGDNWGFGSHLFGGFGDLVAALFRTGVLALIGVLVLLVARGAVDNGVRRISGEPWKALFAGLLVQLFFLPILVVVTIVLAVSVIGIPLLVLVPVALLAFVVASLFGFVAVGRKVGAWAERRFGVRFSSDILAVVVGIVLIQATSLIGRVISLPHVPWLGFIGFSLVALGFFFKYVAWTMGMGAMTLVAFGRDWRRPTPAPRREELESEASEPEEDRSGPEDDWVEEREPDS